MDKQCLVFHGFTSALPNLIGIDLTELNMLNSNCKVNWGHSFSFPAFFKLEKDETKTKWSNPLYLPENWKLATICGLPYSGGGPRIFN